MAFNSLVFTKLESHQVPSLLTITIFKAVAALCLAVTILYSGNMPLLSLNTLLWLLLAGVFSNVGDMGQLYGLGNAPNPGYALGIIFTFPVIIAIVSWALPGLGADLSARKLLGMCICIAGALVLATAKKQSPEANTPKATIPEDRA